MNIRILNDFILMHHYSFNQFPVRHFDLLGFITRLYSYMSLFTSVRLGRFLYLECWGKKVHTFYIDVRNERSVGRWWFTVGPTHSHPGSSDFYFNLHLKMVTMWTSYINFCSVLKLDLSVGPIAVSFLIISKLVSLHYFVFHL